jgi:hypothetical protein
MRTEPPGPSEILVSLPVRILTEAPLEPVLSVDGAFGAPGLNLSHWPGNKTPLALKRDLSTGIALAFAELPTEERERLTEGCTALVNNHFDTDGVLSMFAILHPNQALANAPRLLDAAAAGDLFRCPSEEAFVLDSILTAFGDQDRSPHRLELQGLPDRERRQLATEHALAALPGILGGDLAPYESLVQGPLEALRADQVDLQQAALDDLIHLDYVVRTAPMGAESSREANPHCFDPGRHALWGAHLADRQLVLGPGESGTTCRFLIGTRSFFDMVTETPQPRPDLEALARELNAVEGTDEAAKVTWRFQSLKGASPELWFGLEGLPDYIEHAGPWLAPSSIDPTRIKSLVVDAVRATWVWPEEQDEDEPLPSTGKVHFDS